MVEPYPAEDFPTLDSSMICVQADMSLRHQIVANMLDIERPHRFEEWYEENNNSLQSLLERKFEKPVVMLDARKLRKGIHDNIRQLKARSFYQERMPYVISLDPVMAGPEIADYLFQESRVSIVDVNNPHIDLEFNKRGYVNRFVDKVGVHNGAGKSLQRQMDEIRGIIQAHQYHVPVDVIVVDGFANSGKSIVSRFGTPEIRGRAENKLSVVLGAMNSYASEHFREADIEPYATVRFRSPPNKCIDQTDMLPTLGGRAIGWERMPSLKFETNIQPLNVGRFAVRAIVAVDAVTGGYPWQIDMNEQELTPYFKQQLTDYSTQTAHEFWDSLGRAKGAQLKWGDLSVLTGITRFFYPARDKQNLNDLRYPLAPGPAQAIERIMKDEVYE